MLKKIILIVGVVATLSCAQTVRITTGEWQPWISETLRKDGVIADVVKQIFKSEGIDVQYSFYPWKRAYNLAKVGKYDASAVWFKNKDREKQFFYSKPIFATQDVLIYKKGKKIKFEEFDDLKKYKIAITRGYSYGETIDNMIKNKELKIKIVNNDLLALKQIEKRNNFDLFICAKSVAKSLIADNFKDSSIFEFHSKPTVNNPLYLIVSKKVKNGKEIIDTFNKGLEEFKSKGLINQMINDSYNGKYK